jgi:small subunit ribosomal protein S16
MVKIRLRRIGKTKQPSYRLVIADSRSPRDGRFIEIIGHYQPVRQPKVLEIDHDRARYWLGVGAQPSQAVHNLLQRVNILDKDGRLIPEAESDGMMTVSDEDTDDTALADQIEPAVSNAAHAESADAGQTSDEQDEDVVAVSDATTESSLS